LWEIAYMEKEGAAYFFMPRKLFFNIPFLARASL
jgi:hypothetical protein